jgi:hypothetical protein
MPAQIEVDVAARLAAAGLGLTLATNLFYGPLRDEGAAPDQAVTVLLTGSYPWEPDMGGVSAPDLKPLTVQVNVRSAANDYAGGSTLASACAEAIHKQESGAANVSWEASSAPTYLGPDNRGRHRWALNFLCRRYE